MNQQEGSLNERIYDIVEDVHADVGMYGEYGGINRQSRKAAVDAIERLVLQEKIDLVNNLWKTHVQNNKSIGANFADVEAELQNQLKQL